MVGHGSSSSSRALDVGPGDVWRGVCACACRHKMQCTRGLGGGESRVVAVVGAAAVLAACNELAGGKGGK